MNYFARNSLSVLIINRWPCSNNLWCTTSLKSKQSMFVNNLLKWLNLPRFCCETLHDQDIQNNCMSWVNWYINIISNFSDSNSTIAHNHFLHCRFVNVWWCAGTSRAWVIFNVFTTIIETLSLIAGWQKQRPTFLKYCCTLFFAYPKI